MGVGRSVVLNIVHSNRKVQSTRIHRMNLEIEMVIKHIHLKVPIPIDIDPFNNFSVKLQYLGIPVYLDIKITKIGIVIMNEWQLNCVGTEDLSEVMHSVMSLNVVFCCLWLHQLAMHSDQTTFDGYN